MVSINNFCGVDSTNVSPAYGQSQTFSPPMFSGENLNQPTQDSFVSEQPKKESFYQKNKLIIWALGIGAAVGVALVGHKIFKLDKELGEKIGKITESVDKLDKDKVVNDAKALAQEHKLKNGKDKIVFVDFNHPESKKIKERFEKLFPGRCKDVNYAMVKYNLNDNNIVNEKWLKLYKTKEVDQSVKELLGDEGLFIIE